MIDLAGEFGACRATQPPLPGSGATSERFRWLFEHARRDVALARLLEADSDARAIAADLGVELVDAECSYGVWAAAGGSLSVSAYRPDGQGGGDDVEGGEGAERVIVGGSQPWAGGAGVVERALVLVRTATGSTLVDVPVDHDRVDLSGWRTPTLATTATGTVHFDRTVGASLADGDAYLSRPGFWHGGIGVAACWAGAAAGLLDAHRQLWVRRDPHSLAQLGAAHAEVAAAEAVVIDAARQIDADTAGDMADDMRIAETRARAVRFAVDGACRRAVEHLSVGAGPYPLAMDDDVPRRTAELLMTLRQSHALRDVEPIGAFLAPPATPRPTTPRPTT